MALTQFRMNPKTGSMEQVQPMSQRAPMRYVGGSGPEGRPAPNVGGATWAMNSFGKNAEGGDEFFAGPSQWKASFNPYGSMARIGSKEKAPDVNPGMGSLDDFYMARSTDPITGLSMRPMANDVAQQRARMQGAFGGFGAGAPTGRDASGNLTYSGGSGPDQFGLGLLDAYSAGRDGGNPYLQAYAGSLMQGLKEQRLAEKARQDATDAARNVTGAVKAMSGMKLPWGMKLPTIPGMARGGRAKSINPYLVGEKGPEIHVPDNGMPEVIGAHGPEVRMFPQAGEIIPNSEIKPMELGGRNLGSRIREGYLGAKSKLGDAASRNLAKTMAAFSAPAEPFAPWQTISPYLKPVGDFWAGLTGAAEEPAIIPLQPSQGMGALKLAENYNLPAPVPTRTPGMAALKTAENYDLSRVPGILESLGWRTVDADGMSLAPNLMGPPEPLPERLPVAPSQAEVSGWLNPYLSGIQNIHESARPLIALQRDIQGVRNRMTAPTQVNPLTGRTEQRAPVMALSAPQSTEQVFQTKYGTAGVNFGPRRAPTTIEGIDAVEWFRRAANRQGEPNKYAKSLDKGYKTAGEKYSTERRNLRKAGVA